MSTQPPGPEPLTFLPCGEVEQWTFSLGHWCGEARDSVGIRHKINGRLFGCVLTRDQVSQLRRFLEAAEASWMPNPPDFGEVMRQCKETNVTITALGREVIAQS